MKKVLLSLIVSLFLGMAYSQNSLSYLENAANNGDAGAQKYLADIYFKNNNNEKAYYWYLRAAEQGDNEAQYILATDSGLSLLVEKSGKDKMYWLEQAAFNGNLSACTKYAELLIQNKDPKAFAYSMKMQQGELNVILQPQGGLFLGDCYFHGIGVSASKEKAEKYWLDVFNLSKSLKELNSKDIKNDNEKEGLFDTFFVHLITESGKRLGDLHLLGNKIKNAISFYKEVYDAFPYNSNKVLPNYAWALFHDGYNKKNENIIDEAFDLFSKASSSDDKDIACQGYIGLAFQSYIKNGEEWVQDGLYNVHKAISLATNDERIFLALATKGLLHLKSDEIDSAIEIWNQLQINETSTAGFIRKNKNSLLYTPFSLFAFVMSKSVDGNVDLDIFASDNNNDKTFVVVIANEHYKRVESVSFANNDGKIFKEYCVKTLGIPETNVQYIEEASYNDIKFAVNWLSNVIDAYEGQAKIIFYYSGHGIPDEKQSAAYLLPVDGYSNDITTAYKMDDLYVSLGSLASQSVMIFLDACFSGTKREGDMMASARGVAIKVKKATAMGNMVIFSASQGDETAYPYRDQKHGMFTYYLLKKLQETKGEASLGEICDYVISEVKKNSIVKNGKLQTPTVVSSDQVGLGWKNWKLK